MDIKVSYMRDVYTKKEIENISDATFTNAIDWKRRTVNGIEYRDPDYNCCRLYDDVNNLFFEGKLEKSFDVYDKRQIVLLQDGLRLTTDYIGPSLTSMKWADIPDQEAWNITVKCRTVGGHLIWPRIKNGINPSKAVSGKCGYGISDRIDIALYEIKCVLDKLNDLPTYNQKLRNSLFLEENMRWFAYKSFHEFCESFFLLGSFVDQNDEIIWMADPVLGKVDVKTMRSYIEKNYDAICTRNSNILNKIDKSQV